MRKLIRPAIALAITTILSACGGGGGGVPDTTAPAFLAGDPDESVPHCMYFDDSTITASFDEAINSTTVDNLSFAVVDGVSGTPVTGTFDFTNPSVPTFVPGLGELVALRSYDVNLSVSITDLGGNPLAAPVTWSFNVDAYPPCPPPTPTWNNDPLVCACE